MDGKSHTWLKALSKKLDREDLQNLLDKITQITEKNDREMASAVLEVSIGANRQIMEELKGDDPMFETLMEIMEPKIAEIRKEGRIQGTIETLRNLRVNMIIINPIQQISLMGILQWILSVGK